jgi:hypothetical protein
MKQSLLFVALFLFSIVSKSQSCAPPLGPTIVVDIGSAYVNWTPPISECDILFYEVEYSGSFFTPGMGEGTLISPVYTTFADVPSWTMFAWVRSVCDCEGGPGGEGDGEPDNYSIWVEATLNVVVYPDPGLECFEPPEVSVASPSECGDLIDNDQSMSFIGIFDDTFPVLPSCLENAQYVLWRTFTAPASGAVEIFTGSLTFGSYVPWNDMGLFVRTGCDATEIFCVPSMPNDAGQILSGLTSGQTYYVGVWTNDFEYFWDGANSYNGVSSNLFICETEAPEDFGIYLDNTIYSGCPNGDEAPEYELGTSWDGSAEVEVTFIQTSPCGTISYFIEVADSAGHTASAGQELIFTDVNAPVLNCPDTLWYSVSGNVMSEMPDLAFEFEVDAGACDTPFTWVQTPLPGSILGPGVFVAEVSVTGPCGNTTNCGVTIIMDLLTGIEELRVSAFELFPNPAKDFVTLLFSNRMEQPRVVFVDVGGRQVKEVVVGDSVRRYDLSIEDLAPGIYHMMVWNASDEFIGSDKFVVK